VVRNRTAEAIAGLGVPVTAVANAWRGWRETSGIVRAAPVAFA